MYQFKFQDAGMGGSQPDAMQQGMGMGGSLGGMMSGGSVSPGGAPDPGQPGHYVLAKGGGMDIGATIEKMAHQNDEAIHNPGWNGKGYGD